jgi:putative copper resistance protein D
VTAPSLPPPVGPWSLATRWSFTPIAVLGCGAALFWYVRAWRRVRPPGGRFRLLAFVSGIAVVFVALVSGIDSYADVSFTIHMVQHLLLSFVAPPLLALGAPVTLALRDGGPRTRSRIRRLLRSPVVHAIAHPVVGFTAFVTLPFVLHFTPLYDLALRDTWVHAVEHVALLAVGALFWWPLVGADPMPRRPGHAARVVWVLLLLPAQSFLALAIFSATEPLYPTYAALPAPFGPAALGDQRTAAAIMWVFGAIFTISVALAAAASWRRADVLAQARAERLEDGSTPPTIGPGEGRPRAGEA